MVDSVPTPTSPRSPLDPALVVSATTAAVAAAAEVDEPARAIDAAVGALHEASGGLLPSVFVLEHDRLWLVSQRGYAVVPDGISIDTGIMGRAARLGRPQLAEDVGADRDYVPALPGVEVELAVPLSVRGGVVGMLNLESERALPNGVSYLVEPLADALAPLAEQLRGGTLDLAALARLFVQLGSLREPIQIAALAAASLPRVLPLESSHVLVWEERTARQLAAWAATDAETPLTLAELETARALVDPTVVCQLLDTGPGRRSSLVWLPLRANRKELGALAGVSRASGPVDPVQLDAAAVLAAHVAASLDAAILLQHERRTALTDPLTGVLNRRGVEEQLDRELRLAQERRLPVSLVVIDCDDLKEINDRAGHEFGDALLVELARVLTSAVPDQAAAGRLGGDEFVVLLPGAGVDGAEELGDRIRRILADGLTDAGFPLRVSAGTSTFPFDGGTASSLLRAADQALYAAKTAGKDRVASFRDLVRSGTGAIAQVSEEGIDVGRRGRSDRAALAEVVAASSAIEAEETAEGICSRLSKALVFFVGATACSVSRIVGDRVVDLGEHALREVWLGDEAEYRLEDFPLTEETVRTGKPRAISFLDGDVDPAEAFILRELGMNALLMLPLHVRGRPWGLIELYEMRLRRFTEDDLAVARFLVGQAERRLGLVADDEPPRHARVYELPPGSPRGPRTR
jgi:diguanylate cyclase (GGDEF)-like protein